MARSSQPVELPGSARPALPDVVLVGLVDPSEWVEVTIVSRRRSDLPIDPSGVPYRLPRSDLEQRYGADLEDMAVVARAMSEFGLNVAFQDVGSRRTIVGGTVAALAAAFGAELTMAMSAGPIGNSHTVHRYREGPLQIPAGLDGIVEAVLGLDNRPQARPHAWRADPSQVEVSYTPEQLADIYQFPAGLDGAGQHLAIIELGGGFFSEDLDNYFAGRGRAVPSVAAYGVDGAVNVPELDARDSACVVAHIEIAGALAPAATQSVFFAPNTDRGLVDALATAIHAEPAPTALSISWGQAENAWTPQALNAVHGQLADAVALGITVCAAVGNHGSSDGVHDGMSHVDFPASSPYALACGGTSLHADPETNVIHSETVWNGLDGGATGGGVSAFFALPAWQADAGVPASRFGAVGRGVPDVAANADPRTGYDILVDGRRAVVGGTSVVAPLWAALTCRLAQATGQTFGLLHRRLYEGVRPGASTPGLRSITTGDNGDYTAGPGWDACTGLGTPVGAELLANVVRAPDDRSASAYESLLGYSYERAGSGNGYRAGEGGEDANRDEDGSVSEVEGADWNVAPEPAADMDAAAQESADWGGVGGYYGVDDEGGAGDLRYVSPAPGQPAPLPPPPLPIAAEAEPRWILQRTWDVSDAEHPQQVGRAFRADAPHLVEVQIGPLRPGMQRATGGPPVDDVLPGQGEHDLVILFVPQSGDVQSRQVRLPATGASDACTFQFRTGASGTQASAQILLLFRDRVLQAANLRGDVLDDPDDAEPDAAIQFTLAVIRPGVSGLESRAEFDAALVVAHPAQGMPTAVGIHADKVSRFDDQGIERAARTITAILTDLADNPDAYAPPLDNGPNIELLRRLAHQGVQLYEAMGRHVVEELAGEDLTAIQVVVSDPNDFIPVELVYDLPPPTITAGLCANWRQALEAGYCDPDHHPASPADPELAAVICPLGFWALSKVIERQVADRDEPLLDLLGQDFGIRSEPKQGRQHLYGLTGALFAASLRVDRVKPGLTDQVLATLSQITEDGACRADTWEDWIREVRARKPPLLVLLAHTEKVQDTLAMEIGSQQYRLVSQITSSLVKAEPDAAPVVLLLGCDTAVADREYQSFASRFRDKGAALVVGTIAAVLGEHAAPVAQAIAMALRDAAADVRSGADAKTFGITMRDIRRKLLADGELMSLCLATFGDADWLLAAS